MLVGMEQEQPKFVQGWFSPNRMIGCGSVKLSVIKTCHSIWDQIREIL